MKKRYVLPMLILFVLIPILTACSVSPQLATCAYIVGNGQDGYDAKVHKIVYPGESRPSSLTHEYPRYVPCNSRNYIINDGSVNKIGGEKLGDRNTLTEATTKSGTHISIASTAGWTLNQSKQAMLNFYKVCFKYTCFSESDEGGEANSSTKGWNEMLAENFGPAMDAALRKAAYEVKDSIWQTNDPEQYKDLADRASAYFKDMVSARTGYPDDLFCGSGNSAWTDPDKPGEGEFICTPVRIIIEDVKPLKMATDSGTAAESALNASRLENAQKLYGPDAGKWLAIQDSIQKCKDSRTTCIFNIGDIERYPAINAPTTCLPAVNPTPTP